MPTSLKDIQAMYWKCRISALAVLVLLIASLALVFADRRLTLAALAAAVLCHLLLFRRSQKAYTLAVTRANLEHTVCRSLNAAAPEERTPGSITSDTIRRSGLMPFREEKDSPLLCWQIAGKKGRLAISLCDAAIAEDFQLSERGKKRVHFNSGVWAHIELPSDCGKRFRLIDEVSVPTPIRMEFFSHKFNYETASIDDDEIAKRFVLYRPAGEEDQRPSKTLLASLKRLMEYTPGYAALSVNGSQMDVFLRGRFLARPVSVSRFPTKESLEFDPFPELSYLVELANAVSKMGN